MCDTTRYFVFYIKNGEVVELLGTTSDGAQVNGEPAEPGVVELPRAFMLGKSFDGFVWKNSFGNEQVAFVDINARPLAL